MVLPATGSWSDYKKSDSLAVDLPKGTYTIRLTIQGDGANMKDVTLKLEEEKNVAQIPVESVSFDAEAVTVKEGERITLVPVVAPAEADDASVVYRSSNEKIAVVDQEGVVTGVAHRQKHLQR